MAAVYAGCHVEMLTRSKCRGYIGGGSHTTDRYVREALVDRFGGTEKAVGTKKAPGQLYGMKEDMWSALAVAITCAETRIGVGSGV